MSSKLPVSCCYLFTAMSLNQQKVPTWIMKSTFGDYFILFWRHNPQGSLSVIEHTVDIKIPNLFPAQQGWNYAPLRKSHWAAYIRVFFEVATEFLLQLSSQGWKLLYHWKRLSDDPLWLSDEFRWGLQAEENVQAKTLCYVHLVGAEQLSNV